MMDDNTGELARLSEESGLTDIDEELLREAAEGLARVGGRKI